MRPIGLGAPESQVRPHPRRLHQHGGTIAIQEVHVPGDLTVLPEGVRDVGVDVILRGSRRVVGRSLFTVDGAPREQRSLLAEHLGTFPGLWQQTDPVAQGVACDPGGRVGQEGYQVDLGVPEIVSLITGTGHPFGGDSELIRASRCLGQLEQTPADGLLNAGLATHLNVRVGPEVVEPGALSLEERIETPLPHAIEGAAAAVVQLRDGHPSRGVVGDRLADDDRHSLARLDAVDLLGLILLDAGDHLVGVRGLESVFRGYAQRHVGIGGLVSERHSLVVVPLTARLQHSTVEFARAPWVETLLVLRLAVVVETILSVDHLGAEHDRRIALHHGQFDFEQRQVPIGEADHATGTQFHPLARRSSPHQVTGQASRAEVKSAFVVVQVGLPKGEGLVVDVDLDELRIGYVHDGLPRTRESEGLLGVLDGPGLVETVDEGAVRV